MKINLYTKLKALAFGLVVIAASGSNAFGQCNTAGQGQWPGTTFTPACIGTPEEITGCAYTDEYSVVAMTNGETYTFTSEVATDFITICDAATNTPIISGVQPLVFNCVSTEDYNVYRHLSAACDNDGFTCRDFFVQCGTPPPPLANDSCTQAITIACGDVISGSTLTATADPLAPLCTGGGQIGVWYHFVGTGLTHTFSLCGSGYDTYLSIYSGTCGALACEQGNDDFCGLQSEITMPTTLGTDYYIMVHGFLTSTGTFDLSVTLGTPPANDVCATATPIVPGTVTGNTICATQDTEVPCGTASDGLSGGLWYTYTPVCTADLTATVCDSAAFDTRIRVFDGTGGCGALTCVWGNDDTCATQSAVTWTGNAGTPYYILVHGADGEEGPFSMTLTQVDVTPPVPDATSLDTTDICAIMLWTPTATDACAGSVNGTTTDTTYYATPGVYNVTWTFDDGNGNTSTQSQTVTILADATPPTIACPGDTVMSNDAGVCGAAFNYFHPNCTNPVTWVDQLDNDDIDNGYFIDVSSPWHRADDFLIPNGDCWDIQTITANLWEDATPITPIDSLAVIFYDDAAGAPNTIINQQVLYPSDWTSTYINSNFGYDVSAFTLTLPSSVNLCGGAGGTTYWLGLLELNPGTANNAAWSQTTTVTGYDAVGSGTSPLGPWTPTPGEDHVFGLHGVLPGTVSDNCPECPTVVQSSGLPSGSVFPVGVTTNTFVATDNHGNSDSCSFTVTVNDTELPVPVTDSMEVYNFGTGATTIPIVDNGLTYDTLNVSGVPPMLSSGTITSVCVDMTHTWVSDLDLILISPMGTAYMMSSANGGAGDNYTNTCFDESAALPITAGAPPFTGSWIPQGPGGFDNYNGEDPNGDWVLMVADNFGGDVGIIMDFQINFEFHYDSILPVLSTECDVLANFPIAIDNCADTVTATTTNPTTFTSDTSLVITWTYDDGNGNTTIQTQEVFVDDITAPVADTVALDSIVDSCSVTVSTIPTATDNCMGAITGTTTDPLTYNTAGTYTITWTYDDGRGNMTTQTQVVVVIDNEAPVPDLAFLPNVVGNCVVSVDQPPTATDNCGGTIIGTTTDATVYNIPGTYFIIWTFDDGNGNTWTQNQTVVVEECIGIEEENTWNALVYPNPGNGQFTLSLSELPAGNTKMELYDNLGQVIYTGNVTDQIKVYDFSYLAAGTYFLHVTNGENLLTKQIIVHQDY